MSLKNAAGGVMLIAGTTVGAAVIVLPVETAHLGFNIASFYFVACWFFMTMGALYVLEANLQVGFGTNLISMAQRSLGPIGQGLTWLTYLLLLYSLTAAYLNMAGSLVATGMQVLGINLSLEVAIPIGALIVTLLSSSLLILGTHTIDLINRVLIVVLLATIVSILSCAIPYTKAHLLYEQAQQWDLKPLPLIITGFGFAIIVPTLTDYLHGKDRQLKRVILIGSLFPLVLYLLWEMAILGMIPQTGESSLLAMRTGHPQTEIPAAISQIADHSWLAAATQIFSIFALTTSILGVTLSLFDFLADGLHFNKNLRNKAILCAITFIPPMAIVSLYPDGFRHILRFAGIYVSLILGIFPALMVYRGRYHLGLNEHKIAFGGKIMIGITLLFFVGVIAVEILHLCGFELVL